MSESRDKRMAERLKRLLAATDEPITIDKGHELPIYGAVAEPPKEPGPERPNTA